MTKFKKRHAKSLIILAFTFIAWIFVVGTAWLINTKKISINPKATSGTIFYVSPNGNNSNSGLSSTQAFQTITYALSKAVMPGDEVHLLEGTYKESIRLNGRQGTKESPIIIIGESSDPTKYPVLDGLDAGYLTTTDKPMFALESCKYISFERLKIINSTLAAYELQNSHYITIRRNIIPYHKQAIKLKNNTSHVLIEYNEAYQQYPSTSSWTALKGSKWEGAAVMGNGDAGMHIIRYNYFHDMFNGVLLNNPSTVAGKYYSNNVWVYSNRFENIIDDAFEPETFAINNHFFHNTVINAHRMASFATGSTNTSFIGPVYVYANYMVSTKNANNDSGSNSALKVELNSYPYSNGVYVFNNTFDIAGPSANTYGVDSLNTLVKNLNIMNNIFAVTKTVYDSSSFSLTNSQFKRNLSPNSFLYNEPEKIQANPLLVSSSVTGQLVENGKLQSGSVAIGQSIGVNLPSGFANSIVVSTGTDLGAYSYSTQAFHRFPTPVFVKPNDLPGTIPTEEGWPADTYGGVNPLFGTKGQGTEIPSPTPQSSTPTPVASTPTPLPSTPSPSPLSTLTQTIYAVEDSFVSKSSPSKNFGTSTKIEVDGSPVKIGLIKFNLSSITQAPSKATLWVKVSSESGAETTGVITINQVNSSWSERSVVYKNIPAVINKVGSITGATKSQWLQMDVTNIMRNTLSMPVAFSITTTQGDGVDLLPRESGSATAPKLEIIQ